MSGNILAWIKSTRSEPRATCAARGEARADRHRGRTQRQVQPLRGTAMKRFIWKRAILLAAFAVVTANVAGAADKKADRVDKEVAPPPIEAVAVESPAESPAETPAELPAYFT